MIYLDNNATTPLALEVIKAITQHLSTSWANPSSNYSEGAAAKQVIQTARQSIARMIGAADEREVIFTSGGTEANNWLISSTIKHFRLKCDLRPHVVTTAIEHDAVRLPLDYLVSAGDIDVTYVAVDINTGSVSAEHVISAIRPETCLVSVMLANNETGVIQPVREIGLELAEVNKGRLAEGLPRVEFHTDAAQALGKISVDVQDLSVHFLTIVGHKFYGPRIGALYRRSGAPLLPLLFGGGQEEGLRPGTENTPMIAGLGEAAKLVTCNLGYYRQHFENLQNYLETSLKDRFGQIVSINFLDTPSGRLPNTTSLSFKDSRLIGSRVLSMTTDLRASLGAACHSNSSTEGKPSPVLVASGVDPETASRTLRLSTGRDTTETDIDRAIDSLSAAIDRLLSD